MLALACEHSSDIPLNLFFSCLFFSLFTQLVGHGSKNQRRGPAEGDELKVSKDAPVIHFSDTKLSAWTSTLFSVTLQFASLMLLSLFFYTVSYLQCIHFEYLFLISDVTFYQIFKSLFFYLCFPTDVLSLEMSKKKKTNQKKF